MMIKRNDINSSVRAETIRMASPRSFIGARVAASRKLLLGISSDQAIFATRGFAETEPGKRIHLERIGQTFLFGYNAAIESADIDALGRALNSIETETVGFAFEGASMALALMDMLTPFGRGRLAAFLEGPGSPHVYMVHVGVGWAFARSPWGLNRMFAGLDALLSHLAFDGYGFHEGYFHWPASISKKKVPRKIPIFARNAFDQGLGRSLWFVMGANTQLIIETIASFPVTRQPDLWSGVGLASTYAGGVGRNALESLRAAAGEFIPQFAQGVCFAAKARQRANNVVPHTELACQAICGMTAETAADLTDRALSSLPQTDIYARYQSWRFSLQAILAARLD